MPTPTTSKASTTSKSSKTKTGYTKQGSSNVLTVGDVMTPFPHSVGKGQSLEVAHKMMRKYGIRHLPVLEGGRLVGVISQRDLYLVETLKNIDTETTTVEEAMSPEVFCAGRDHKLAGVIGMMQKRKYGCAVVMDGEHVIGVFTTVDALRVLAHILDRAT